MDLISAATENGFGYRVAEFVIDEVVKVFFGHPVLVEGRVDADQLFLFVPASHPYGAAFSPSRTCVFSPADVGFESGEVVVPYGAEFLIQIKVVAEAHTDTRNAG